MNSTQRFLNAALNQQVDRPPVWIMRQAGRTLPEYRALREQHGFWKIMTTPELAARVTLQPIARFPLDAAVIFSDILTIPAAMGMKVAFTPKLALEPAIRSAADVAALNLNAAADTLAYVGNAIRQTRSEAGSDLAILGFSGAPYTLASYMVEGGSSKNFHRIKSLMFQEPAACLRLLTAIADVAVDYLLMQIDAGADAVQLFDSWAGELSPADFRRFALPAVQHIVEGIAPTGKPVIYYVNGIGNILDAAQESGAGVLGIDWRLDLATVRERLGGDVVVQGNLDPTVLFAAPAEIRRRTFAMLDQTGGTGHIVNLGHGVLPETPLEGIRTFIDATAEWARKNHEQ